MRLFLHVHDSDTQHVFEVADEFKENEHPRKPDGKFGTGGASSAGSSGGGSGEKLKKHTEEKPYTNYAVAKILKNFGYKKGPTTHEGEHLTTFTAPNGAKITIHHPKPGTASAANWTSEVEGHGVKSGTGTELEKLLGSLAARQGNASEPTENEKLYAQLMEQQAASKAAQPAAEKPPKANGKNMVAGVAMDPEVAPKALGVVKSLIGSGYTGGWGSDTVTMTKGAEGDKTAAVVISPDGKWTSSVQGHYEKSGETIEGLVTLLSGKAPVGTQPWKNGKFVPNNAPVLPAATPGAGEGGSGMSPSDPEHIALYKKLRAAAPAATGLETGSISAYTGSSYASINDCLRYKDGCADAHAKNIESYLNKSSIPEPITVYRGMKGDFAKFLKSIATKGTEFVDKGFLSTSTSGQLATKWGQNESGLRLRISVPKGAKGAPISHFGSHSNEHEVLFQAGSKMRVVGYSKVDNTMDVELVS